MLEINNMDMEYLQRYYEQRAEYDIIGTLEDIIFPSKPKDIEHDRTHNVYNLVYSGCELG